VLEIENFADRRLHAQGGGAGVAGPAAATYYNPKDAQINKDPRMSGAAEVRADMRAGFAYDIRTRSSTTSASGSPR
jgi:hypothetical protein